MRKRSKWTLTSVIVGVILAGFVLLGFGRVLPASAVKTCETAFGEEIPVPASLTAKEQEDAWTEAQGQALAETRQLVAQPSMVAMMKADLMVNKRDALRYASIAYVLGYNGIDTVANVRRLRGMFDTDPSEPLLERLVMIADPTATDDTIDVIPERVFDICERHPTPDVLQAALSMQCDGGPGEVIADSMDELLMRHPNELMAAIAEHPDLEQNVAFQLYAESDGDKRVALTIKKECSSTDPHIRSAASYCAAFIAHPVFPSA